MSLGVSDTALDKLARYGTSKSGAAGNNNARDFHRFVHREGKTAQVEVTQVPLRIATKRANKAGRRIRLELNIQHPMLLLSSWMEFILKDCPQFFLAGHHLEEPEAFGNVLESFWSNFKKTVPGHVVFEKPREQLRCSLPICVHGDEGRGLGKSPVLVTSYQVIIPWNGSSKLNFKKCFVLISHCSLAVFTILESLKDCLGNLRHSYTTRLLHTVMPSTWYASNDATSDGLTKAIADDLTDLFHQGICVEVPFLKFDQFNLKPIACQIIHRLIFVWGCLRMRMVHSVYSMPSCLESRAIGPSFESVGTLRLALRPTESAISVRVKHLVCLVMVPCPWFKMFLDFVDWVCLAC